MDLYLGTAEKDGSVVSIAEAVRRKHVSIWGKTGCGKTTLLRNMALSDLEAGGCTVIDPHGSLIEEELLPSIPRHRTNDVIYFNPAVPDRIIGINVLEDVGKSSRHLVVSSILSIIKNLWPQNWGPRSEWILEHALYALLESPEPVTLAALPKFLTDARYRASIVSHVTDPAIRKFFDFYEHEDRQFRDESITPVLNKVSKFTSNPVLRAVIGQPHSSFDFRRLMDERRLLLCNLSKGALGEDVSSLLGSLIVTKLALASLSRQDIPEHERRLHTLYVDEVQAFVHGINFSTILAESRKYALSLVIATQMMAGLPDGAREAIFGNCGTLISFRVSGEDAHSLVSEFGVSGEDVRTTEQMFDVIVPASELQNLPDYKIYIRTLLNGRPVDPYLIKTFPRITRGGQKRDPHAGARRDRIAGASLTRFARHRNTVEKDINRFLSC